MSTVFSSVATITEINSRISDIINLVTTSGISITTVSSQIRELEISKNDTEDNIQKLLQEEAKIRIREKEIKEIALLTDELIKGSKAIDIEELIKAYVDKVLIYQDKVEIYFKASVVDNGKYKPLMVSEYRENIFERYGFVNR